MSSKKDEKYNKVVDTGVSVDCVLVGFDGAQLNVLLVKQKAANESAEYNIYKLPGSLIYMDEDLDEAAQRVLCELTGLKAVKMRQFKAFGGTDRLKNPKDVLWLTHFHGLNAQVQRIVTIAYLSLLRLDRKLERLNAAYEACWMPLKSIGTLAFDHNELVRTALEHIRQLAEMSPGILFDLLPHKFTAAQLRTLYEVVFDQTIDVRNFHKKMAAMPYIVPLDEREQNVTHRAARFYKFDRVRYNQTHS